MDFKFESNKDRDAKAKDIDADPFKDEIEEKLKAQALERVGMKKTVDDVEMVIPPKIRGMLKVLEGNSKALMKAAVAGALKGNVQLLKFCLDRLLPESEYIQNPTFSLPERVTIDTLPEIAGKVVRLVSTGHLTSKRGKELAEILQTFAQTVEVTRTESRLRELEEVVKSGRIKPISPMRTDLEDRGLIPANDHFNNAENFVDDSQRDDEAKMFRALNPYKIIN